MSWGRRDCASGSFENVSCVARILGPAFASMSWAGINNTHFWVDPKRQIAAVILMQVQPFYDEACMKIYHDFEEAIGSNLRP